MNFLETNKEYIFSLDVDSPTPSVFSDLDKETDDRIKALQAEIFVLQEAKTKIPSVLNVAVLVTVGIFFVVYSSIDPINATQLSSPTMSCNTPLVHLERQSSLTVF